MSSSLTASMQARRHPETTHIDRLATADMLAMLHQDDKQISEAVGACLPDIARLIDIATATISRGGRLVIIGAGASGRTAIEAVSDYSPEGKHALVGLIAGYLSNPVLSLIFAARWLGQSEGLLAEHVKRFTYRLNRLDWL